MSEIAAEYLPQYEEGRKAKQEGLPEEANPYRRNGRAGAKEMFSKAIAWDEGYRYLHPPAQKPQ